ncbi:RluA family pseudouridine synthase [Paenibacillus thermotolerans]|uniref:RluA family pseudouridine synthase n=1 Tax=Paenibacillus thermotolerans TaxID=3027807 RepID=UPI002367F7AD|nr:MULTISPECIES: RluA family pseudouridine synthase [unclassified Paenibacillus]
MITRTVTPSESGKRLHRYIRNLMPNYPLGQIYKMIEQGKVKVNGKRKKQNYEMTAGDELTIYIEEEAFKQSAGAEKKVKFAGIRSDIDVVFEDDELLVVNKPVGLLTHPDQSEQRDTLINRVHAYLYKNGRLDSQLFLPATANRLDRNTSGLVLVGKTAGMLHRLNQWIQKHELQKYYITIVQGKLSGDGTISGSLVREEGSNRTIVVAESAEDVVGKSAVTKYRALRHGQGYTLVEVELVSGRTHQIRTHFQSIGHPLLGDIKYGGRAVKDVNHQLLHAYKIVLPEDRTFTAEPPSLFRSMLRQVGIAL